MLPFAGLAAPPERIAILGNAAGTTARELRRVPARDRDRRRRDRPRARGGRQRVLRHGLEREPRGLLRGRAAMAPALGGRLRRDLRRRLSPALHPLLPGDEGVLRARPRAPRAGRGRWSSTPATPRATTTSRRSSGGRSRKSSRTSCAIRSSRRTRCSWRASSELSADSIRAGTEDLPTEVANLGATEASRFGELLAGGEVYTDDRAPVEWLIDRSILGYAGEHE